ncbi:hypothetical protein GNI_138450 [Gregarina niphandrodes]|uniref:Uncharacterized protein n=1 Tax=Gregarina niphandrodes TaxID=110365 RepID=A0A023B0W7_GRENI|nr:hypothetical protein GNI_138450 [Gregarina niphandrodes]EZG45477.1 hypothetical protein GNI_138450 [Gregarina niphandrodes]|eukprot:XP_011132495.1 hypothetical protein GNI_138450 [Gregarina niphandrodes]
MSEFGALSMPRNDSLSVGRSASVRKSVPGGGEECQRECSRRVSSVDEKLKSVLEILKSNGIEMEEYLSSLFRVPGVGGSVGGSSTRESNGARSRSRLGELDVGVFHRMLAEFVVLTEDVEIDRVAASWEDEIYDQVRGLISRECNLHKAIPVIRLYLMVQVLVANLNIKEYSPLHFAYVKNSSSGFTPVEQADLRKCFIEIFRHGLEFVGLSRQVADALTEEFAETHHTEEQYLNLSQDGESLTAALAAQQSCSEQLQRRKEELEFVTQSEQEALRRLEDELAPLRERQSDLSRALGLRRQELEDLAKLETRGGAIDVRGLAEVLESRRREAEVAQTELASAKEECSRQQLMKSGVREFGDMLQIVNRLLGECSQSVAAYKLLLEEQDELRLKHTGERSGLGTKKRELAVECDRAQQELEELSRNIRQLKRDQQKRNELLNQLPQQAEQTDNQLIRRIDELKSEYARRRSEGDKEANDLLAAIQALQLLQQAVERVEDKTQAYTSAYASTNANALKAAIQHLTQQVQEMA